jgi:hypothetical protein
MVEFESRAEAATMIQEKNFRINLNKKHMLHFYLKKINIEIEAYFSNLYGPGVSTSGYMWLRP